MEFSSKVKCGKLPQLLLRNSLITLHSNSRVTTGDLVLDLATTAAWWSQFGFRWLLADDNWAPVCGSLLGALIRKVWERSRSYGTELTRGRVLGGIVLWRRVLIWWGRALMWWWRARTRLLRSFFFLGYHELINLIKTESLCWWIWALYSFVKLLRCVKRYWRDPWGAFPANQTGLGVFLSLQKRRGT